MSNLLKGFYIAVDKSDKRVIDSNELISEKLIHIRNTVNNEGFSSEGFCAGLNPVNVSEMLDENNHILGENVQIEEAQATIEAETKKEDILNAAMQEAEAIVNRANEDALSIIENAKAEAERVLQEARNSGYAEGMQSANQEAEAMKAQLVASFEEEKQSIIAEYRRKEEQLEPELVDVILRIFADITKCVSVDKKDMILHLVNNVMTGGEASRNFIIRASVEDVVYFYITT